MRFPFSKESGIGEHWFVLFRNLQNAYELFDSLGIGSTKIKKIITNFTGTCFFNETAVQSITSDLCGHFVVYVIIFRLFNWDQTFEELLNDLFTENTSINEKEVLNFVTKL